MRPSTNTPVAGAVRAPALTSSRSWSMPPPRPSLPLPSKSSRSGDGREPSRGDDPSSCRRCAARPLSQGSSVVVRLPPPAPAGRAPGDRDRDGSRRVARPTTRAVSESPEEIDLSSTWTTSTVQQKDNRKKHE